jgi:hypothetical protein
MYSYQQKRERSDKKQDAFAQQAQARLNDLNNPFSQGGTLSVSGTNNEISGRLEGLERARMLTGQNMHQIGQDYQEAYGNIKKRTELSDTGSELLRANKAGAVATARQELQQSGVKGGASVGATSQVERAKAYDVNNQLQQAQRQAETDYMNAAKANANFTNSNEMNFAALMSGKDMQAPQSGGMTVICTELYRQGYFPIVVVMADREYGRKLREVNPEVYYGYRLMADPIVKLMQKSKLFTKAVAFFAVPWAFNMAGEYNTLGSLISMFGEPLCYMVGKLFKAERKYGNQEA